MDGIAKRCIAKLSWRSHREAYSLAPSGNLRQRCHEASDQGRSQLSVLIRASVLVRPEPSTWSADQSFREIEAALTALSISTMSALSMLSGVIGPTSL